MKTNHTKLICGLALLGAALLPATVSGQIYVGRASTIGEYNSDGTPINTSLITGLSDPFGIVVSGGDIFVANLLTGTIGEYNPDGTTVNASLVTGLHLPYCMAVSGGNIFVANYNGGPTTIGEYTTGGATVNASLVSGLDGPECLDVETVPEPSTFGLLALGLALLPLLRRHAPCPPGRFQGPLQHQQ